MQIVDAAAHLEEVEGVVHELLGGRAGLEWAVVKGAAIEASEARGDGSAGYSFSRCSLTSGAKRKRMRLA
jgi:hypothetical protein